MDPVAPLIVLDAGSLDELEPDAARLRAEGWTVIDRFVDLPLDLRRVVCRGVIRTDSDAADAVLAAAWRGGLLLAIGPAPDGIRERLLEDLARIGPVRRVTRSEEERLVPPEADALLGLLSHGVSLGEAARRLHLSRRTADRRLADARRRLGVRSTTAAIAAWRAAGRAQPGG